MVDLSEPHDLDQRVTDPHFGIFTVDVAWDTCVGDHVFLVEEDHVVTRPDFLGIRCDLERACSLMSASFALPCSMMSR